jgi:Holliday junction resolvase RusA-like endonuclease
MDFAAKKGGFVHVYSPHAKEYHESMHKLVGEELEQLHVFVQTPCTITINAYEKTPSSFNVTDTFLAEYGLILNTSQNDYDNILKLASDRLNDVAWLDDSLVVSGTINKLYSILPREEIFIRYLNCATCPNQYKKITNRNGYRQEYAIDYLDRLGVIQYNKDGG